MAHAVYVTRHGARIDNGPDADRNWLRAAGHSRRDDPHLSPSGEQGAQELAQRLAADTPRVSHIVSSPFVRCVQTADAVAAALGLSIRVEPGVSEVLTTFPPGLLPEADLQARFPRIDAAYEPVVRRDELRRERGDGEAARRAERAAAEVSRRVQAEQPGQPSCVLFVGHGASCLGIVEAFGGHGYVGYTSLSRFDAAGSGGWRLVGRMGDVAHLSDQATALGSAF